MTDTTHAHEHIAPDQVHAYVDGELPADEALAIRQHLAGCHACALQALATLQLKAATARSATRFQPTPDVLARLTRSLQPEQPKPAARVLPFGMFTWMPLAAVLLLAVSLFAWQDTRRTGRLSAELLDQHLAALSAAPEVVSTDRHTVKPWFQGKLPFSFNLPETLPADMALKGGDLTYLEGQPAALLLFTIHQHKVSVFLTERSGPSNSGARVEARSGFTVHTRTTGNLRIVAVSDVNPAELDTLLSVLTAVQADR